MAQLYLSSWLCFLCLLYNIRYHSDCIKVYYRLAYLSLIVGTYRDHGQALTIEEGLLMSHKRWEESGQSTGEHAGAFFGRTRKRLGLLAALGSVRILQRVLSRSEASILEQIDQLGVPKTASTRQSGQQALTEQLKPLLTELAKQPSRSVPHPVETSLESAEQLLSSLMPLPVLRTGARVREEASAIWTEAQAIRHRRNHA